MKNINIKESLINIDKSTDFKYTLTDLYEACRLTEDKRKELVQYIEDKDIPGMSKMLSNEAGVMTENVADDLSDEEIADMLGEDILTERNEWFDSHPELDYSDESSLIAYIDSTMRAGKFLNARWTKTPHTVKKINDSTYEVIHKVNGGKVTVNFDTSDKDDMTLKFDVNGKHCETHDIDEAQDFIIRELEYANRKQFDVAVESLKEGFQEGDVVWVKPSNKPGRVCRVKGEYIEVEIMGGNDPDRRDVFYPEDLELEVPLNENWTDAYEKFTDALFDVDIYDTDAVQAAVERVYRPHEGEPDWDEAWRRWNEEPDPDDEMDEELLNEGPGAVLGDLAGKAVGDVWQGVKNFAKGVKDTAVDVSKTAKDTYRAAKETKTAAKARDAVRAVKGAKNWDEFKQDYKSRQDKRQSSDSKRDTTYKGNMGKTIGDVQDWKFVVNGKKMSYDQFREIPEKKRAELLRAGRVKCYDIRGRETSFRDQAKRLSGLKEHLLGEAYAHFDFKSGANPYISFDDVETAKMLRKYDGRVNKINDRLFTIDDTSENEDKFAVNDTLTEGTRPNHPEEKSIETALLNVPGTTKIEFDWCGDDGLYRKPENHLIMLVFTDNNFGEASEYFDNRYKWKRSVMSTLRGLGWTLEDPIEDNDTYLYLVMQKVAIKESHMRPSNGRKILDESSFNKLHESNEEEDKPFTHAQIFDELKRETSNFSIGNDSGIYSFEKEVKMAEKILKKHYENVKVTERGNDFMIEFSGPKNKKKKVNESSSLTESKGRFELEVWVPGSGGDDRERFIMASNNLQDIIEKAYEIDLDSDEAFYLRDMKDIYPYDLDQCYDAEELEDAIYNEWHYDPQTDTRKYLGKMLLPQREELKENFDDDDSIMAHYGFYTDHDMNDVYFIKDGSDDTVTVQGNDAVSAIKCPESGKAVRLPTKITLTIGDTETVLGTIDVKYEISSFGKYYVLNDTSLDDKVWNVLNAYVKSLRQNQNEAYVENPRELMRNKREDGAEFDEETGKWSKITYTDDGEPIDELETSQEWEHKGKDGRIGRIRQSDGKGGRKPLTRDQAKEIAKFRGHEDDELYPVKESKSINEDRHDDDFELDQNYDLWDCVKLNTDQWVVIVDFENYEYLGLTEKSINHRKYEPIRFTEQDIKWLVEDEHALRLVDIAKRLQSNHSGSIDESKSMTTDEPSIKEIRSRVPDYLEAHPYSTDMDIEDICEEVVANLFDLDYHEMSGDASYEIFNIVSRYVDSLDEALELTADEMRAKHGTDNPDIINAGKEEKDRVALKEQMTYTDTNGFLGEPGEKYTMSQFRRMWQDKDNDPVMSGYDSFEEWVGETISQMDAHEDDVAPSGRGALSCAIFTDTNGVLGEPGEKYTVNELADYWSDNRGLDPSLAAYNGNWMKWLDDTLGQMEIDMDTCLYDESLNESTNTIKVVYTDSDGGTKSRSLEKMTVEEMIDALDMNSVSKEDVTSVEGCTIDELFPETTYKLTWKVIEKDDSVRDRTETVSARNEQEALKKITDENAFEKKATKVSKG